MACHVECVLEGAVEEPHADGPVVRAAEDALAVGHRRHRVNVLGVPDSQVLTLALATLHTLTSLSSEALMMCWPSGVTATARTQSVCPLKVWTSVPSTCSLMMPRPLGQRPTTKCTPSGSAATHLRQDPGAHPSEGAQETKGAVERGVDTASRSPSSRDAAKRAPPGSTATARWSGSEPRQAKGAPGVAVHSHAPSRHTLTVLSFEPVTMRPSVRPIRASEELECRLRRQASNTRRTRLIGVARGDADGNTWHVGAARAMWWARAMRTTMCCTRVRQASR